MQCPKCGTPAEPKAKPAITKKQLLLHVAASIVVFGSLFLLSHVSTVATLAAILWLAWRSTEAAREIKKSQLRRARKVLALLLVIVLNAFILWILLFKLDAEPIANDYTVADLRSAWPKYAQSYELLNSLADKDEGETWVGDAPGIGLSKQDVDVIEDLHEVLRKDNYPEIANALRANTGALNRAWTNAEGGRAIIGRLSTYPQMADLTEPDWQSRLPPLGNLKKLTLLCCACAYLETEMGGSSTAVSELTQFDSAWRKLSINARSTLTKLACVACLSVNIRTANFIANHPRASKTSLELLAGQFTPFTDEQLSWRNQIIYKYLTFRNLMKELPLIGRHPAIRHLPFFKRNSTLRMSRNWHNAMLDLREGPDGPKREQLSVWPWIYPDLGPVSINPDGRLPWHYRRYNRLGCQLLRMGMSAMGRAFSYATRLKVEGDLLQIVLNKRLGREVSLKASAYSDEYIVDIEGKKIFSPGPDGEVGTDDDIALPINPSVLQWPD
ncbi:MAG: hypothetical protein ACYTEX_26645 [Planctomycetota bacterium]|jgi:hypothetical protein